MKKAYLLIALIFFIACVQIKGQTANVPDTSSASFLDACRWGDESKVHSLLDHGANINARSPKGRTALMVACAYYAKKDVVKILLDKGASVNAVANDGTTALMLASEFQKADIVELLLRSGADAKKRDNQGKTALDYVNMNAVNDDVKKMLDGFKIDKEAVIAMLQKAMK